MKVHTVVINVGLAISVGCLGSGYLMGGYWVVIPVLLGMTMFWITTRKKSAIWSATALLLIYITLAAIGVIMNLAVPLMVLGCTSALVCWDLMHFRQSIVSMPSNESRIILERDRLQSLAAVVFTSLLLTLLSLSISLQLRFGVIVLLVVLAVGCLTYAMQYLGKQT